MTLVVWEQHLDELVSHLCKPWHRYGSKLFTALLRLQLHMFLFVFCTGQSFCSHEN
jgi:hypothetical protein